MVNRSERSLVSPIEKISQLFMVESQQGFVEQATLGLVGDYLADDELPIRRDSG